MYGLQRHVKSVQKIDCIYMKFKNTTNAFMTIKIEQKLHQAVRERVNWHKLPDTSLGDTSSIT